MPALDDQHRALIAEHRRPKRTLVGIVKVPRVFHTEESAVPPAEMRHQLAKRPEPCELNAVESVVQVVVAEELVLLDADRGEHRDGCHPVRLEIGKRHSDPAAHAEADEMGAPHPERIEQLADIERVGANGIVGNASGRSTESRQVGRDHPIRAREPFGDVLDFAVAAGTAVEKNHRSRRYTARRHGIEECDSDGGATHRIVSHLGKGEGSEAVGRERNDRRHTSGDM
jgi:hypothetical protein